MKAMLKRILLYGLTLLPMACLQQEIRPILDRNTRACLLRQQSSYNADVGGWSTGVFQFKYNKDGNPLQWSFLDQTRTVVKIYTFEFDGLRLKRMNWYSGSKTTPDSLVSYKTYDIDAELTTLVEHTFKRNLNRSFDEVLTRQFDFFRNPDGELRVQKIDYVLPEATATTTNAKSGKYKRLEYDEEGRNLYRIWSKNGPNSAENLDVTFGGYDLNGRNPFNVNFWMSFAQGDMASFVDSHGSFSENNITLFAGGFDKPFFYIVYELNAEGFPCLITSKQSNLVINPGENLYYYYDCDCQR
ncbi:hypothetical protein [Spirosoma areae]